MDEPPAGPVPGEMSRPGALRARNGFAGGEVIDAEYIVLRSPQHDPPAPAPGPGYASPPSPQGESRALDGMALSLFTSAGRRWLSGAQPDEGARRIASVGPAALDMVRGAGPAPRFAAARGGFAFWLFGLTLAVTSFWVSGGHVLFTR